MGHNTTMSFWGGGEWDGLENPETDLQPGLSTNSAEWERQMKKCRYADRLVDSLWDRYVELKQSARTVRKEHLFTPTMFAGCFVVTSLTWDAMLPVSVLLLLGLGLMHIGASSVTLPRATLNHRIVWILLTVSAGALWLACGMSHSLWCPVVLEPVQSSRSPFGGDPILGLLKSWIRVRDILQPCHGNVVHALVQTGALYDDRFRAPEGMFTLIMSLMCLSVVATVMLFASAVAGLMKTHSAGWLRGCTTVALMHSCSCAMYCGTGIISGVWSQNRFLDWGWFYATIAVWALLTGWLVSVSREQMMKAAAQSKIAENFSYAQHGAAIRNRKAAARQVKADKEEK